MFVSARGAKCCVCAAVTAETFDSSATILKVTDVTNVTDVIAGSSVGGRSECSRAVTHGRAGANGATWGGCVEQLWSISIDFAIFGLFQEIWCENVFTAHVQVNPCDFRPLNLSFIHISDLPKR